MEIVTKEYLENNIKAYDNYRGLGNKGKANGIATLDANGKLSNSQIPVLPETKLAVAGTNNATINAAVDKGSVYINTYDVKEGEPPKNTSAISITGSDGINVTSNGNGDIQIKGHEKPPVLNTNNNLNSDEGNLVPKPNSTSSNLYLRADGKWYTPTDTKVKFIGTEYYDEEEDSYVTSDPNITGTKNKTKIITRLVAGQNIVLESDYNGVLTINGPEGGVNPIAGEGLNSTNSGTNRTFALNIAELTKLGGIKVGAISTGNGNLAIAGETGTYTIYTPPINGKYYPVEVVSAAAHKGHAVVKIPDVPSPFYEEDTNDKFSIAIEDYKIISYMDKLSSVFTGETSWENTAIQAFLNQVNSQIEKDADKINTEAIFNDCLRYGSLQVTEKKGLSITCPSNVLFAQLDCEMDAYGINMLTPIKSTKKNGKQTISIMNSCPNAGFSQETSYYAYLRFTTKIKRDTNNQIIEKAHTYNGTIVVDYDDEEDEYTSNIII